MFKAGVLSIIFTGIPVAITIYNKYKYARLEERLQVDDCFNYKCLFITSKNRTCTSHIRRKKQCGTDCSYAFLKEVLNIIHSAKDSICLCMYHITLDEIALALIKAKNRGVKVRCISDTIMMECSSSKLTRLKHAGIETKVQNSHQSLMHHKFMLIDECNPQMSQIMFGSLNHTIKGFLGNWDHIICSNNAHIIKCYQDEFENMWKSFKFV